MRLLERTGEFLVPCGRNPSTPPSRAGSQCRGGINVNEVTLINSTMSDNTAGGKGGGIHATNYLTLTDSTVSGNTATSGGGIFLEPGGTAVLTGTNTFNNNVPDDCVGVSGC